jgi:perosamine synthetase
LREAAQEKRVNQTGSNIFWWRPEATGTEIDLLREVVASNYFNDGGWTRRFEKEVARRVKARFAVATTSGTTALFCALKALGIGPGDEVLVPDITFIATANAASLAGASVVLVDVDPVTLAMCPDDCRRRITSRSRAIIPVHVSGRGGTVAEIAALGREKGIPLVEDAAEALLSAHRDRFLGTYGALGCFSFSPNKTLTTGQGGLVVTDDASLCERLRALKDQGRIEPGTGGDDLHPTIGFNFKFTNLQAAFGLAQLDVLEERVESQKRIYREYREGLAGIRPVRPFPCAVDEGEVPQWTDVEADRRDALDAYLKAQGISCRRFWLPLHTQKPYFQPDERFPVSTRLAARALWLPSAFQLTTLEIRTVCSAIQKFYES